MDDDRAESIQSAIVRAGRTADTIQAIHDVVEGQANVLLDQTKSDENILSKVTADIDCMKGMLPNWKCRTINTIVFGNFRVKFMDRKTNRKYRLKKKIVALAQNYSVHLGENFYFVFQTIFNSQRN